MATLTPTDLQTRLETACPGISNSLGFWSDKSTWTLIYPSGATDAQRAAAQAVIDAAPVPLIAPWQVVVDAAAAATLEARRAAIQARLESLIAELNAKYSIELSVSLSVSEASALLLAACADWTDCNNLKLLYDTINTMGGIKTS